ncbi:DNA methyltransferase [Rhizobium wenxiniae]|uniref:Very-short-patch-repair endonuclease n=1 Tax=Rhizobium wenxiniae TaxID=1737357 RepID=A0A7W9Y1E9_9HYPH|nr:DUF559 domain-containing protein [Rhizobium wenxiniae]MBB6160259.1 very-short-patch-repair endonuclease [Rhizobium wenxiniae]GGF80204.1 DNA methyltransferase [Rhizobium wenxiniae]
MHRNVPDQHRQYAKAMRADSTRAENLLWQQLRRSQIEGFKFKRQVPLDGYILDFICFEARMIIEVDGSQHAESASDKIRDAHFSTHGFRILRFWNAEVEDSLDSVVLAIRAELLNRGE